MKSRLLGAVSGCATALVLSTSVNAVVLNTLNGVNYQWLELTETVGLSRRAVESRIADSEDVLFGYEYASRQLLEDLLLSYTSWDGVDGFHADPDVLTGYAALQADFGVTRTRIGDAVGTGTSTDGYSITGKDYIDTRGVYGKQDECETNQSCLSFLATFLGTDGSAVASYQVGRYGYDAADDRVVLIHESRDDADIGSYLVKSSVVPVPAAVWLFGSGLLGLVGMARRKKV